MVVTYMTPDQLRVLENTAVSYDHWMQASRALDQLLPALHWKTISNTDYLYASTSNGTSKSFGKRTPETEQLKASNDQQRIELKRRIADTKARLAMLSREYRAHYLPRVHPVFGAIAREADLRGMMGSALLVIGTNAMPVYEIEAQDRFATGLDATEDCDFAWADAVFSVGTVSGATPFYSLIKSVDASFAVNYERDFQARNSKGYEVELLIAPSIAAQYPTRDPVRPLALPQQEWLIRGRPLHHVLFDQSNLPVKLVVPDPRWMALHKLWLSKQPERNSLKRPKDAAQGELLLKAVREKMPQYPLDENFIGELSMALKTILKSLVP